MRGESADRPMAKVIIVVAYSSGLYNTVNTQLGQTEGRGVCSAMHYSAKIGDLVACEEVSMAFGVREADCV